MSQLTFEGFTGGKPEPTPLVPASWYKGRTLSHSSISLYRSCPQKWKFRYVDKVPEKPKSFFSFGKSVHTGLEFLFENVKGPLPTLEEVLAHYKEKWISEGYETAPQEKWFFQEGERILKGFYAKNQASPASIFEIEYKFNVLIEGVPVTGYIDRIDTTPKGALALIDYKTGKAFDKARVRSDSQLTMYQIAVQEVFQKPVESVTLYHLNSLTPLTVPAHSKTMEDNLRETVKTVGEGISAEKFDPKPDERGVCQWCDYMQICPAWAGKKLALKTATSPAEIAEKVDKLGKLDARLAEMNAERAQLAIDVSSALKMSGQDSAKGKYFLAKREVAAEGTPEKILVDPIEPEGSSES